MSKIILFFRTLFAKKTNLGVLIDPRTNLEIQQDYPHSEVVAGVTTSWKEKIQSEWKQYSIREQIYSSSCLAHATSKGYEAGTGIIPSAHPIYRRRENFPKQGMWLQNAGDIWKKQGSTTEALDVSNSQDEQSMDRDITLDTPLKIGSYYFPNSKNIDEVAQAIDVAKAVTLLVHGNASEWKAVPKYNNDIVDFGHGICAVDYFLYNGEKALLIEDSFSHDTSLDGNGRRIITESYLKARIDGAMYFLTGPKPTEKPKHTFTQPLQYGLMNNNDVKALQAILAFEGFFTASTNTGNMLQATCGGLKKWQLAHGITDFQDVYDVRKIRFGAKSIELANRLYA